MHKNALSLVYLNSIILIVLFGAISHTVSAQMLPPPPPPPPASSATPTPTPTQPAATILPTLAPAGAPAGAGTNLFGSASIPNKLSANTVGQFFAKLIDLLIFLGFIGAGFAIVFGGIMMMLSLGNEQRLSAAKSILTWAVIGFVILLLSKVFILIIENFIG